MSCDVSPIQSLYQLCHFKCLLRSMQRSMRIEYKNAFCQKNKIIWASCAFNRVVKKENRNSVQPFFNNLFKNTSLTFFQDYEKFEPQMGKIKIKNAFFFKIRLFLPKMQRTKEQLSLVISAKLRTSEPQINFTGS